MAGITSPPEKLKGQGIKNARTKYHANEAVNLCANPSRYDRFRNLIVVAAGYNEENRRHHNGIDPLMCKTSFIAPVGPGTASSYLDDDETPTNVNLT